MMRQYVLLLAIVAIALTAGVSDALPPKKIVGGLRAESGEFPYQVSLHMGDEQCGGTIITNRHVLTAAHCVYDVSIRNLSVWTGSVTEFSGQNHTVKSVHCHSQFSYENATNDIAIIALNGTIELNDIQNSLALPNGPTPNNVIATVTGWGYTNATLENSSTDLLKATVMTLTAEKCQEHITGSQIIHSSQICGHAAVGIGFCGGDSGSPLVRDGRVIGIASLNVPCGTGIPDIYTNVYYYVKWIKELVSST